MAKAQHASGTWEYEFRDGFEDIDSRVIISAGKSGGRSRTILEARLTGKSEAENEANARRIVAAVNACDGIPIEALEQSAVKRLLAACEALAVETGKYATSDQWPP